MKKLFYFDKENCRYEPIKTRGYILGIGALAVTFSLGWVSNTKTISRIFHKRIDTVMVHTEKFSEGALVELLMDCNVKYPYIVLAQAKLESGNFTSKIFKQNNNMFGMRKARRRITSSQSEKNTYAYYDSWKECIYDMGMWQNTFVCNVSSEDGYFRILQEKYAEDSTYVSKLRKIIEKEKLRSLFQD
jgi:hypothetical protein